MSDVIYKEHGTDHEKITSWQKILILLDEDKSLSSKFIHLGKHYKIRAEWEKVLSFIETIKTKNYIDQIFELDKKFSISVNKCKCKGKFLDDIYTHYDINGMCKDCGLKIKQ